MNYEFVEITESHRHAVIDIFNYFIENTFCAYPEKKVPYEFFSMFLQLAKNHPVIAVTDKDSVDKVIGFALMRPYHPFETLRRTAELSYFILPEYERRGIGKKLIAYFIECAKIRQVDCLLAGICSLNTASIDFHRKAGFEQCGCFRRTGRKQGKDFDIIWMQKLL